LSPLSRMKFVISRKAWYVIGRSSGMEWGGMVYLEYLLVRDLVRWADRQMLGQINGLKMICWTLCVGQNEWGWGVELCFGDLLLLCCGRGYNRKSGRFLVFCVFHFLVERIGCSHRFFASFSSLPCAGLDVMCAYIIKVRSGMVVILHLPLSITRCDTLYLHTDFMASAK
jgi:hypothetical protein